MQFWTDIFYYRRSNWAKCVCWTLWGGEEAIAAFAEVYSYYRKRTETALKFDVVFILFLYILFSHCWFVLGNIHLVLLLKNTLLMHLSISIGWILHITENENRNYVNAWPLYHKLGPATYYIKIKILFCFKILFSHCLFFLLRLFFPFNAQHCDWLDDDNGTVCARGLVTLLFRSRGRKSGSGTKLEAFI